MLTLDTFRNGLTETQGTLDDVHCNIAEDDVILDLVNKMYKKLGQTWAISDCHSGKWQIPLYKI